MRRRRRHPPSPGLIAALLVAGMLAVSAAAAVAFAVFLQPDDPVGQGSPQPSRSPATAEASDSLGSPPAAIELEPCPGTTGAPEEPIGGLVRVADSIATSALRLPRPDGITYMPTNDAILLSRQTGSGTESGLLTTVGDPGGGVNMPSAVADAGLVAFDAGRQSLITYATAEEQLYIVPMEADGGFAPIVGDPPRVDLRGLELERVDGVGVDPLTGELLVLDLDGPRIVRISLTEPGAGGFEMESACAAEIGDLDGLDFASLTVRADDGRTFVSGFLEGWGVWEVLPGGELATSFSLTDLELDTVAGATFAPSGDPTDDPATQYLYIADVPTGGGHQILALSFEPAPTAASPTARVELVGSVDTASWSPASPDPSGIDYDPLGDRLIVTDAEVEELEIFEGANVFTTSTEGDLGATGLTDFSVEPTDVAVDPVSGHYFVSDDGQDRILEVDAGADGLLGTEDDDTVSVVVTRSFDSFDPEGVAFGLDSIFIADGLGSQIFRVARGPDGEFNGAPPDGDDVVTSFDTLALSVTDPEDVAFDATGETLLFMDRSPRAPVVQTSVTGELVRVIDTSSVPMIAPSGVALAPSSDDDGLVSLYVTDRGVDNARQPRENDGRIYEMRILGGAPETLIANRGFEIDADADGAPDGWVLGTGASTTDVTVRGGSVALVLRDEAEGAEVRQDLSQVVEGTAYRFSAWINVPPGTIPNGRVRLQWRDAAGTTISSERALQLNTLTAGWIEVTSEDLVAPAGAVAARLTITAQPAGAVIILDELLLIPVG